MSITACKICDAWVDVKNNPEHGDELHSEDCPDCKGDGISRNSCDFEIDDGRAVCRVPCRTCQGDGFVTPEWI